jgi:acyl-CoA synthetase (AMP-forming)/AMP-acid ligase II
MAPIQPELRSPSAAPASMPTRWRRRARLGLPAVPGLRPDRMRLGGQSQSPRRRRRRCRPATRSRARALVDGEVIIRERAPSAAISATMLPPTCRRRSTTDFSTGDLGHSRCQGHLHLSGRRKNLLITSFGRNIAPEWIEAALLAQPASCRPSYRRCAPVARGRSGARARHPPRTATAAAVARANEGLPDYARVGHWIDRRCPVHAAERPGYRQRSPSARPFFLCRSLAPATLAALSQQCPTKEPADVVL